MAFCIECGRQIEDGQLKCRDHQTEHAVSNEHPTPSPVVNVNQYVNQWLPIVKDLLIRPYEGMRSVGLLNQPLFGLAMIGLGAILKAVLLTMLLERSANKLMGMVGLIGGNPFARTDEFEELFENLFWKAALYDVLQLLLLGVIVFAVIKIVFKKSVSLQEVMNGVGATQVYIVPGMIIGLILVKLSVMIGIPFLVALLVTFPIILQSYLRENGFLQAGQIYAVPLIFFITLFIDALLA